ncbi:unnamed protein product [Adineta ricciae]|uniref:MAGE domain-containing protein n=1 Tax=Adineta ricciae TaxID=249248 RepID=A0A813WII0_ADIRI|nr:unnamed protein product [Adineta ricciae]
MPPKKSSQAVVASQMSMNVSDSDDPADHDTTFDDDANLKPIVIKRLDWINTVLRPMGCDGRKAFPAVHKQVAKALNDTFGYKLVSDEKHDGRLTYSIIKSYILVNALKQGPLERRPLTNPSQNSKYALLMIIVACLKRAGGEMSAVDFWAILSETLSIRNEESTRLATNQHKLFGDVQKLIRTDFPKEGYLIFDQAKDLTGDTQTTTQTVKLGFRAQHEFPDEAIDEFIEKVGEYGIESDTEENNNDAMEDDT